jgi:hypothetical protein
MKRQIKDDISDLLNKKPKASLPTVEDNLEKDSDSEKSDVLNKAIADKESMSIDESTPLTSGEIHISKLLNQNNSTLSISSEDKDINKFLFKENGKNILRLSYKDFSPEEVISKLNQWLKNPSNQKVQIDGLVYRGSSAYPNCYFKSEHIPHFCELITSLKNLSKIGIIKHKINAEKFKELIDTLYAKTTLTDVTITGSEKVESVKKYALKLFKNNKLINLDLGESTSDELVDTIMSEVAKNYVSVNIDTEITKDVIEVEAPSLHQREFSDEEIKKYLIEKDGKYIFKFKGKDISPTDAIDLVNSWIARSDINKYKVEEFSYVGLAIKSPNGYFKSVHISELCELIDKLKNLSVIQIKRHNFSASPFKKLIDTLKDKENLTEAHIICNSKLSENVYSYALKLFKNDKFKILKIGKNLSGDLIKAIEMKAIGYIDGIIITKEQSWILENKHITIEKPNEYGIKFNGQEISPADAINFSKDFLADKPEIKEKIISFTFLGCLNGNGNYFNNESIKDVRKLTEIIPSINKLTITNHKINFKGLESLLKILNDFDLLEQVTLTGKAFSKKCNEKIGDLISNFIKTHPKIIKFDLDKSISIEIQNKINLALEKKMPVDTIVLDSDDMDVQAEGLDSKEQENPIWHGNAEEDLTDIIFLSGENGEY